MSKSNPANRQSSFSQAEYAGKKKRTRHDLFLAKMQTVVPWDRLIAAIEPYSPKSGPRGRQPIGIERMLRMYLVQQGYGLADVTVEDALYDSQALRNVCGIDLAVESMPDATTLMDFRHLLESHKLPQTMLHEVNALLKERGLLMSQGTLIDATLIAAPRAMKNKTRERDPDMHQTKKGNQWHPSASLRTGLGMEAPIGADDQSGLVHTVIRFTL
jgi:IS5 family transposase